MTPDKGTAPASADKTACVARRLLIDGRVQGVGFRPYLYRLARAHRLDGWVRNRMGVVEIHVQGSPGAVTAFVDDLLVDPPPLSLPRLASGAAAEPMDLAGFKILDSLDQGEVQVHVPPDLYTCPDCLAELNDPGDRRYHYPFINCTQCGPRYTLIRALPYDRAATTMAGFALCPACLAEYRNPANRRFHAEPVACPDCGPGLSFHGHDGQVMLGNAAALAACLAALSDGQVVAVKGIGGYHLLCDARSDATVNRLRSRKPRPHKPLAIMFPADTDDPLGQVNKAIQLSPAHAERLLSAERPIVLARKRPDGPLSSLLAPGLDEIGVMLPYSPLHHLLLAGFAAPLVATSANISGEPVLTENTAVEQRLGHVAEAFLHHDRPIQRPADDPVYRVIADRPRPLRQGRGNAPLERDLPFTLDRPVLAVGGHMKNTVALAWQDRVVVSPHIGDMGTARSLAVFEQTVADLQALYGVTAEAVVCDAHPGYATTRWAEACGLPLARIFHHHAHASACHTVAAEQPWLIFTWDGVGYGVDGNLWGGEALLGHPGNWQHFARLRPFYLPGGERAAREPWRSAAALCWETGREWSGLPADAALLRKAWRQRLNTPQTTAAGRLFDAAAALTGVCLEASFEGQGPMQLEAACHGTTEAINLPLTQQTSGLWTCDWEPLLPVLLDTKRSMGERAACFHASLAATLLQQARQARAEHGVNRIGLSGGVFQNRVLTEQAMTLLEHDGFEVTLPDGIPVNDAGLSFGQVIEYAALQGTR
ncbi:MAG: carbamoyltransferase HypF [Gammaproteobacteria bacterium]|nr:carbamoyltransferase HypF [Gammaproteobacteria bacterium]